MANIDVAEVIGESFERALNTGKREDSFLSALIVISAGRTDSHIAELLKVVANTEDKEGMIETLTSYFIGDMNRPNLGTSLSVAEVLSTSFERALGIDKRQDSFASALVMISADRKDCNIIELFRAIADCKDKDRMMEYFSVYFKGDANFTFLENILGVRKW